ncbi:MAG: hypothetical protein IH936_14260 [Acidobacteria bacterium]|nr:hypothetical protein [Acidobacteriota bacterium]
MSRELATAREEIGRLDRVAERSGEVPLLESALEQVRGALGASEARTQALEGQVAELEAARSGLASAAEAESDELGRKLAAVEADLAATRESVAASEATNTGLAAQVAELEAARSGLASAEVESDDLEQKVAGLQTDLMAVRSSLLEAEARNRKLETDVLAFAETRESLAAVQGYNDELSQRLAVLEASAASPAKPVEIVAADEPVKLAQVRQPSPSGNEARNEAPAASVEPLAPLPSAFPPSMTEETPGIAPAGAPVVAPVRALTEPSAAIVVEDLPITVPADIEAFAQAWARAWSDQRVDDYLSFYGAAFAPREGTSRDDWASTRRDRLTRPQFVVVELSNFRTQIHGPDQATVSFDQEYRSDTFQDRVVKTLELVREGDLWKIREEISD